MTDKSCAYIAGPMTGRPEWNHPLFNECEAYLLANGWKTVINPAKAFGGDTTLPRLMYLRLAETYIRYRKPAIVLLDEWQLSDGARMEVELGLHLGLDFWRYHDGDMWPLMEQAAKRLIEMYGKAPVSGSTTAAEAPEGKEVDDAQTYVGFRITEEGRKALDALGYKASDGPAKATRESILDDAKDAVLRDRNVSYGQPEQSFERIAKFWTAYLGMEMWPHDVAAMMGLLKIARIATSPKVDDHWVDLAGYAACGGEVTKP